MIVPRSFDYSSPPPAADVIDEKTWRRDGHKTRAQSNTEKRQQGALHRSNTEPVAIPSPKTPHRPRQMQFQLESAQGMSTSGSASKPAIHNPNALPPAVAALLAVTAIPPRRSLRPRSVPNQDRRKSIDDLISEWKSDEPPSSNYGSSPALSVLFEDIDEANERAVMQDEDAARESYLYLRSASSESMPSLDPDDRSILSTGSPSTPGSLRSRRSVSNIKREKSRSLPPTEPCMTDHPLVPRPDPGDDNDIVQWTPQKKRPGPTRSKTSFKSNLTSSLQSLKNAAMSSITSFSRPSSPSKSDPNSPLLMDDTLWSRPFLFPRFSSEVRPAVTSTPHRPTPLTFEEQEAPFQQALHAPYLTESFPATDALPAIPMQTYTTTRMGKRKINPGKCSGPDPTSEAGRALLGAAGMRQREIRENGDFLRIIVLEMNMRRVGKLESGKARIWLPPRENSPAAFESEPKGRTPERWRGISAY